MDSMAIQMKIEHLVNRFGGRTNVLALATLIAAGIITFIIIKIWFASSPKPSKVATKRDTKKKKKEKSEKSASPQSTESLVKSKVASKPAEAVKQNETTGLNKKNKMSIHEMMELSINDEPKVADFGEFMMIKNGKKVKAAQSATKSSSKKVAPPPSIATSKQVKVTEKLMAVDVQPKSKNDKKSKDPVAKSSVEKTPNNSNKKAPDVTEVSSPIFTPSPRIDAPKKQQEDEWRTVPAKSKKNKPRKE